MFSPRFLVLGVLAFCFPAPVSSQSMSDNCVNCVPAPPCFICQARPSGGEACITPGCERTIIVPCPGLACQDDANIEKIKLIIADDLIRAIGAENPRFAIMLASLRSFPPLNIKQGRYFSMPLRIDQNDVEGHLRIGNDFQAYLAKYKERIMAELGPDAIPGEYSYSVSGESGSFTLSVNTEVPIAADPVHTRLNVSLVPLAAQPKSDVLSLQAVKWQLN